MTVRQLTVVHKTKLYCTDHFTHNTQLKHGLLFNSSTSGYKPEMCSLLNSLQQCAGIVMLFHYH